MPSFSNRKSGESLDEFHQRCVVPTQSETFSRNATIDEIVRFLQQNFGSPPYTVARVLKGGSLGKGTAVRDNADIDLVVVMNGLSGMEELDAKRPELLGTLKREISVRWRNLRPLDSSKYSLTYMLDGQEVDFLPALDAVALYGSKANVYAKMKSYSKGEKKASQDFSASLARLQIEFVKPQGEAVKKVIRLLKTWKEEVHLNIRSYSLELLTIYVSRSVQWRSTQQLFKEVLSLLTNCGSIQVAFNDNYNSSQYTRFQRAPYIMDPANPYMNTLYGVDEHSVSTAARTMLCRV